MDRFPPAFCHNFVAGPVSRDGAQIIVRNQAGADEPAEPPDDRAAWVFPGQGQRGPAPAPAEPLGRFVALAAMTALRSP